MAWSAQEDIDKATPVGLYATTSQVGQFCPNPIPLIVIAVPDWTTFAVTFDKSGPTEKIWGEYLQRRTV